MDYEEKFKELLAATATMRKAQNIYFALKKRHIDGPEQLAASKAAESRVDGIIKKENDIQNGIQQLLLQ